MGHKRLPLGSGERHTRAFKRLGWTLKPREGRGSHLIMKKDGQHISIPNHREVKRPTLAAILTQAGVTEDEYLDVYR